MKNKLSALLVIVALFGITATAAQAHPVQSYHNNHYSHYNNHYYHHGYHCYNGCWYDENGILVSAPGVVISFGF